MSRVKQASKRKRLIKAAGVPALGAVGLGLSLVGSASALPTADLPQSLNTTPNQRFVLDEEEMADVSLATFHVFDKENGTRGFTKGAYGCAAALHVAVALAAVAAEAAVGAAAVTEAAAHRGAAAVIAESMNAEISFHISAENKLSAGCYGSS